MKKLKIQKMLSKAKRQHNYVFSSLQKSMHGPIEQIREHIKLMSDGRETLRNSSVTQGTERSSTEAQKVKMVILGKKD